ncbi:PEP/pyruvate-binding domain-containing protein [Streptomyces sp. 6N223]|uniref:PEP/pyruvate-binding domain-containing protein n=1 Tax=Streptomyces sp. 6N223 TaxID=3457412 RepID=UPI003FD6A90F
MLVPLRDASERCGAKARNLGRLLRAGFRVPDGFVVADPLGGDGWARAIGPALRRLGPGPFAVRSSARAEDGAEASIAGQLTSVLAVTGAGEAIRAVTRSARSGAAAGPGTYAARTGRPAVTTVPVIVQAMVRPDAAGVLFTRHPVTGADQVVIEAAREGDHGGRGSRGGPADGSPAPWRGRAPIRLGDGERPGLLPPGLARDPRGPHRRPRPGPVTATAPVMLARHPIRQPRVRGR